MLAPLLAVVLASSAGAEPSQTTELAKNWNMFSDTLREAFTQGVPVREALAIQTKALGRDPLKGHPKAARAEALVRETEAVQEWGPKGPNHLCPDYGLALRQVAGLTMVPEPMVDGTVNFYLALKDCLRGSLKIQAASLQQSNRAEYPARLTRRLTLNFSISDANKNIFGPDRNAQALPGGVASAGARPAGPAADPHLPEVRMDPRLTRQPGQVPTPHDRDVRLIRAVATSTIIELNLSGKRFPGTNFAKAELGNISRMKLDCDHQADIVIERLHHAGIGNAGDVWTVHSRSYEVEPGKAESNWFLRLRPPDLGLPFFNGETIGTNYYMNGHYWVEIKPKDPKQPTLHIDTWKGLFGVQQPGSSEIDWKPIPGADADRKLAPGGVEG